MAECVPFFWFDTGAPTFFGGLKMARWLAIFAVLARTLSQNEDGIWDSCSAEADCPSESEFCAVRCFTGECSGRNKNCQPCDECYCDSDSVDGTCLEVCGESAVNYEDDQDCNADDNPGEDGFDPGVIIMVGFVLSLLSLGVYVVRKKKRERAAAEAAFAYGLTSSAPDAFILSGHSQPAYNGRYARANDLWNNRLHYVNEQGHQFYFYAVNEGGAPGWSLDARPQDDTKGAKDWCDGGWFPCDVDSLPVPPLGPSLRFDGAGSLSLQPVVPVGGGVGVVLDPAVSCGVVEMGAPVVGVVAAPVVSGGGPIISGQVVQAEPHRGGRRSKVRAVFNF